jgi:hypothetical protein
MAKEMKLLVSIRRSVLKKLDNKLDLFKFLARQRANLLCRKNFNINGDNGNLIQIHIVEYLLDLIEDAKLGPSLDEFESRVKKYEKFATDLNDAVSTCRSEISIRLPSELMSDPHNWDTINEEPHHIKK